MTALVLRFLPPVKPFNLRWIVADQETLVTPQGKPSPVFAAIIGPPGRDGPPGTDGEIVVPAYIDGGNF